MNEVTKTKHPGRVAAGKRTAELNRKRKEDLLNNHKTVPTQVDSGTESVPGGDSSWKYGGLAIVVVISVALYVYRKKPAPLTTSAAPPSNNDDIFCMR